MVIKWLIHLWHGNHDDISRICQYDSTNSTVFNRNSNVITVGKQSVDSAERHCIVFVEYDGCNDSITLKQEKGSSSSYDYTLKFKDEERQKAVCLLVGKAAKFKGKNKNWKKTQILYWKGQEIKRDSQEYQDLLDRAYEALSQNTGFQKALLATKDAV